MKIFISIIFLFLFYSGFSQKSEVVFKSKVNHNYAVGNQEYVENNIDTNRLLFMGTIKMISSNQDILMYKTINLLKLKTHELNGNTFKLRTYNLVDTTLTLLFDVYYMPNKYQDINNENKITDKIIVFNNVKDTLQRKLNVNNNSYSFVRNTSLVIETQNQKVEIKIDSAKVSKYKGKIKPKHEAHFISVKPDNTIKNMYIIAGTTGGVIGVAVVGTAVALVYKRLLPSLENFESFSYETGRVLFEIYKSNNIVTLPKVL